MLVPLAATWLAAAEPVDYQAQVKPFLAANCFRCHGPDKQEAELRLDTARAMLAGGNSGPAIVAGKSGESPLIHALMGAEGLTRMPPKEEGPPLAGGQIALLRRWIDEGAVHPADEVPAMPKAAASIHWAFQPIVRPPLPSVRDAAWCRSPIDAFVLAKLEKAGIAPSAEADRITLLRRVSLDLIGLPPALNEIEAFLADDRPGAYEQLVDRLLASPQYGERWGRHWLDLARYADSNGYTNDNPRTMWKYRDWVIDAFNGDLPFDRFTIEQLAGDMLPSATQEQLVATGFHRNTQINDEGGSDPEQYRVEAVVDRVATTGSVFLGLTLGCARCHDHKYDPISQREFYELFAFFNSQDEPSISIPRDRAAAAELDEVRRQRAAAEKELKELPAAGEMADKNDAAAIEDRRQALTARVAQLKNREQALAPRAATTALVMKERTAPRETYIHLRGEFLRKGRVVQPAVPRVLPPLVVESGRANRLDLANWLASPEHPLASRVTANRAWQVFFGRGLVETENDFGTQGTPPSHPELLDWLAVELAGGGWSQKGLHRVIVTSAVYRQASHARPELRDIDPDNRLLARQNRLRLEAEAIRDATLAASGLLSLKMKGPSVFPPQPPGVMELTRNPGRKWEASRGEDRYRRGVYTYFWRNTPHPFLKAFDAPESNAACTRRDRSNTPIQALMLLNDEAFFEAAQALAVRVLRDVPAGDAAARLRHAFALCVARPPSPREERVLAELWRAELADAAAAANVPRTAPWQALPAGAPPREAAALVGVARALLNLDEFMTRE
jgi:hypothetical protein